MTHPLGLRDRATIRLANTILRLGLTRQHRTTLQANEQTVTELSAAIEMVIRDPASEAAVAELARIHHQLTGRTPTTEKEAA